MPFFSTRPSPRFNWEKFYLKKYIPMNLILKGYLTFPNVTINKLYNKVLQILTKIYMYCVSLPLPVDEGHLTTIL